MKRGTTPGQIRVAYGGKLLATMPVRIRIMPQDWLRYAKASDNRNKRIAYLKRAAAANPQDLVLRRTLGEIYRHAGCFSEAITRIPRVSWRKSRRRKKPWLL